MANPLIGEVPFAVGGKSYTFKLGNYAQMLIERRAKMPFVKFMRRPADEFGTEDAVTIFYAGLYRAHKLTEEQVADLLDEMDGDQIRKVLSDALGVAEPPGDAAAGAPENPPPAKAQT